MKMGLEYSHAASLVLGSSANIYRTSEINFGSAAALINNKYIENYERERRKKNIDMGLVGKDEIWSQDAKYDPFGGMYKYIGTEETISALKHLSNELPVRSFAKLLRPDIKMRRIFRLCNPPEDIVLGSEGQVHDNYILEGVLILLRHGDRGPLSHVRNISSVNCAGDLGSAAADGWDSDASYRSYELFLQNMTGRTTNFLSQLLGPFHGFPLLPAAECQLAQLTPVGAAQLLRIGHLLRTVYGDRLGGFNSTEDFLVYSTRYRRTVQSVVAFLYAFLSPEDLAKVALRESQSLTFCFNDCACAAAERFQRKFHAESTGHLRSHPAVGRLVRDAGAVVFELPDQALASDPHALRDALLAYVCHGAPLPCLDQPAAPQGLCVRVEHVTGLFAYTEWEARQYGKSGNLKRACLLKAYGLLRNIVSNVLRIISEGRPRVVVYSGHDKTLQYLVTALGLETDSAVAPHYGSRLVLEVYKSKAVKATSKKTKEAPIAKEFFFRLVYNGRDVTNRIQFCKGGMNLLVQPPKTINVTEARHGNSSTSQTNVKKLPATYICPIESIVRFLHDDYFVSFNGTNFKDACGARP